MPPANQPEYPFPTLPDYLAPGLGLVLVGINPSIYAVQQGHYFARPSNRFWPALSRSRLSQSIRLALGRDRLAPADDGALLQFGIGFTDIVKVPSNSIAHLRPADYREWAPRLLRRLETYAPRLACFHGITGYRAFVQYGLGEVQSDWSLGLQSRRLGPTRVFVVPNPSGANAHFTLADQVAWYDSLATYLQ
ncbi:MAG TPA: mismatch-specific DNA-glycosylase [Chloroflexota bacterium]|nr:mismatch-specific DNA-glycosylase [Chloroflexota bacterium]